MQFEKSTEPCSIPYGVYHLDHDCINYIRAEDPNALDPEILDMYCGPVYHASTERGIVGFFVPIDKTEFENNELFFMDFENGILFGMCDFKKMLPVVSEKFLTPADVSEEFINFCNKMKPMAEVCADEIISSIKENRPCKTLQF